MKTEKIDKALQALRETIIEEIKLKLNGHQRRIKVELVTCTNTDRDWHEYISAVFEKDGQVFVRSKDDDGDRNVDKIELYSVDEMLKIVEAI